MKRVYIDFPDLAKARYAVIPQLPGYLIVNTAVPVGKVDKVLYLKKDFPPRTLEWIRSKYSPVTTNQRGGH